MLKLARRARGHFVTLIEIRVHLIRVKPGYISQSVDDLFPEAKKTFLALISSLRCCGACYVRLHRLSPSVNKSVPQPVCKQFYSKSS